MRYAIELQRQALAVGNSLQDPEGRAISHGTLSNYLYKEGKVEEEARHRLVEMVYYIVTGNQRRLETVLQNLAIDMQEARQQDKAYPLPKLTELLERAEFTPHRG